MASDEALAKALKGIGAKKIKPPCRNSGTYVMVLIKLLLAGRSLGEVLLIVIDTEQYSFYL
jgi:hypothetical protein